MLGLPMTYLVLWKGWERLLKHPWGWILAYILSDDSLQSLQINWWGFIWIDTHVWATSRRIWIFDVWSADTRPCRHCNFFSQFSQWNCHITSACHFFILFFLSKIYLFIHSFIYFAVPEGEKNNNNKTPKIIIIKKKIVNNYPDVREQSSCQ